MTENSITLFDILHQFIETVEELQEREYIDMRDEIAAAREALDDLHRWCDAEATASAINFEKWREAMRELEALRTLVP